MDDSVDLDTAFFQILEDVYNSTPYLDPAFFHVLEDSYNSTLYQNHSEELETSA